jgi:hypothetical protein
MVSSQIKLAEKILTEHGSTEAAKLYGCPFWVWDDLAHKKLCNDKDGPNCFWHIIGLPEKEHLIGRNASGVEILEKVKHGMKLYQKEWYDALQENRYLWIKKATGVGATTFFLGHMAWLCLRNNDWQSASMGIVTGPRINIAIDEIKRIPELFKDIDYRPAISGATVTLNGCRITAYPSHTFDTARGLEKVRYWFVDEADFFPTSQATKARQIVERYEAKTHPIVVFNSTANLPGGLYETMEREEESQYTRIFSLDDKGIRDGIYSDYEIAEAKKSSGYPREYQGLYGIGIGNIFNYKAIDASVEEYPLEAQGGIRVLSIDPAFGDSETSSKFGIVGLEKRGDIIYVTDAQQFARPSGEAMLERVAAIYHDKRYHQLRCDSAFPGVIRDLNSGNEKLERKPCRTDGVVFKDVLTEMTVNAETKINEGKVKIHPNFADLMSQLKAIEYNDKGHPDKKKLTFDMGDAFIMGLHYWRMHIKGRKLKSRF